MKIEMKKTKNENEMMKDEELMLLLKSQKEFLASYYCEKDNLLTMIERLQKENDSLRRMVEVDDGLVSYLQESFWWKITWPFRVVARKIFSVKKDSHYNFVEKIPTNKNAEELEMNISVVIFTHDAGEEFVMQINNLKEQKLVKNLEIVIIDKGSIDNTIAYAKKAGCKVIEANKISDIQEGYEDDYINGRLYEKCLAEIKGDFVVTMSQNKIINSRFWLYQALRPIIDGEAMMAVFLKKRTKNMLAEAMRLGLKNRFGKIAEEEVFFFPFDRGFVQYVNDEISGSAEVIVKRRASGLLLI